MAEAVQNKSYGGGFSHVPYSGEVKSYPRIFLDYILTIPTEGFLWSMKSVLLGTALLLYYLTPADLNFSEFSGAGYGFLFARNLVFYVVCSLALYLYFHVYRMQGDEYRYISKDIGKKSDWTFGSQLKDNIFWSIASGVTIWSANEFLYFYLYDSGVLPRAEFGVSLWGSIWFVLLFILIGHIQAFHFFIIHRILHFPFMYNRFHALHHRNVSLIPWSGMSMHPVEHVMYLCPWLVFFLLPSHPLHMLFFMHYLTVGASFSHCGYERLRLSPKLTFPIAGFYHQLHHRLYNCNYGNPDFPLDEMAGCNETGQRFLKA